MTETVTKARIRLPDLDDDTNELLGHLFDKLEHHRVRNLLRASYYDGKRAIRQIGTVIPPQYYRLGMVLGWSAKAVDILARRCNLDAFVWADGDLDSLGGPDVWESNYLAAEVNSAVVSSLVHASAFLIDTRGDETVGEPAGLIHVKDALDATGDWNPRTRRMSNLLSVTSRDDDGEVDGFALYLDGVTITAERDLAGWHTDASEHTFGVPVEALVYKPSTRRPLGTSRISRAVMSLHDQALRTVIRMEGHADVYSYPELWMLGADEKIFTDEAGRPKPMWQVMLGRIKGIPDDEQATNPRASIQQVQASSPQPHIDQLKQQAQLFAGETSIPLTSLGVSDMSNPTSADSYIASREDLIAEAEGATDDWAPPLRRAFTRALAMTNDLDTVPPEWKTIDAKWRSPVYLSRAAQADAGGKQLAAVPWLANTEVGLELLGLDEQQIRRAMADQRRAAGTGVLDQLRAAAAGVTSAGAGDSGPA